MKQGIVENWLSENYIQLLTNFDLSCFITTKNGEIELVCTELSNAEYDKISDIVDEVKQAEKLYREYCILCPKAGARYKHHHYAEIKDWEQEIINILKIAFL